MADPSENNTSASPPPPSLAPQSSSEGADITPGQYDLALAWHAMNGALPTASEDSDAAHSVGLNFPENTRYRGYAHDLVAQLRRDGTDSPEHIDGMLKLSSGLAHGIEATKRDMMTYQILGWPPLPRAIGNLNRIFRSHLPESVTA